MPLTAPDLTKRPPRSPRVRLGGYCILPRMLDKGRATLAGTVGEFKFNCPLDQQFVKFAGIDAKALLALLKKGKGDGELLAWVNKTSKTKPSVTDILAWSAFQDQRAPSDLETRKFFNEYHSQTAPKREDVSNWFELLDIDDHVTFGGIA